MPECVVNAKIKYTIMTKTERGQPKSSYTADDNIHAGESVLV